MADIPEPDTAPDAQLARVPRIIDFMLQGQTLSPEAAAKVNDALTAMQKAAKNGYSPNAVLEEYKNALEENRPPETVETPKQEGERTPFAGQVAVQLGVIDQAMLDIELGNQSWLKVSAALQDIQTLMQRNPAALKAGEKPLNTPDLLQANWGLSGVTKAIPDPENQTPQTIYAASASAAANIAQNIMVTLNNQPELLGKPMQQALNKMADSYDALATTANNPTRKPEGFIKRVITDLVNFIKGITNGDSPLTPIQKKAEDWIASTKLALEALQEAGAEMKHSDGTTVDLKEYMNERFTEIRRGVELQNAQMQEQSTGRAI